MSPRTKNNLKTAMEYDAVSIGKYRRFAARARMDEEWELARTFQTAADVERTKYFAREAELAGLVSGSPDNLRNAIDTEAKEVELFAQFAREAREDGDLEVAAEFEAISSDKTRTSANLQAIMEKMGIHSSTRVVDN